MGKISDKRFSAIESELGQVGARWGAKLDAHRGCRHCDGYDLSILVRRGDGVSRSFDATSDWRSVKRAIASAKDYASPV